VTEWHVPTRSGFIGPTRPRGDALGGGRGRRPRPRPDPHRHAAVGLFHRHLSPQRPPPGPLPSDIGPRPPSVAEAVGGGERVQAGRSRRLLLGQSAPMPRRLFPAERLTSCQPASATSWRRRCCCRA
jgi:hypothetical protein